MYMPDNYDRWVEHDREQEEALKMLPKCKCCEQPIQTEYCYGNNGKYICEHCLVEYYRQDTDSLID